jgi:PAS domain S-box-containing protein
MPLASNPSPTDGGRSSEAALREQFEQLSTIFDSMDALLYVADLDTYEVLHMNAYGRNLFGDDWAGRHCFHVLQKGQSGPCAFCTNDRLVRDGEPLPPHVWEFRNTVTGRWFQCIDRAIHWPDGRLVRMEVAIDITERKHTEALLEQANQTLQAVIEASPLAIIALDEDARVTRWNRTAEQIFGWTAAEVLGQPLPFLDDAARAEFDVVMERLRAGEAVGRFETRHVRRDGSPVAVSVAPALLRDTSGREVGSMAVIADITEQLRADEFRRDYIHTISHDLRTPLSVVDGYAQLLLQTQSQAPSQRRGVEAIARAARRMNLMIQDLVDSAREEGGEIELDRSPVPLRVFLLSMLEQSGGALDTDRIRLDVPTDLPYVNADAERLERILMNLLSNALKYSPDDSTVVISAAAQGPDIVIAVADQGTGIDADDVPHVFDRYFRARSGHRTGGVGLGLHIAQTLVEAHGGHIGVESEPGVGSTFSFTLPCYDPAR